LMKEDSGEDESLSDPVLQKGMAILNQYAQGDITNKEAALMFKDLYEKGVNSGPSQDDMHYTTLNPKGDQSTLETQRQYGETPMGGKNFSHLRR